MQAINYPTVPRGQEKLRISPTPHHTVEMMNRFVEDMVDIWKSVGLPIKSNKCGTVWKFKNWKEFLFLKMGFIFCRLVPSAERTFNRVTTNWIR